MSQPPVSRTTLGNTLSRFVVTARGNATERSVTPATSLCNSAQDEENQQRTNKPSHEVTLKQNALT